MFRIRESYRTDVDQILAVAEHLDTVNLPADRGHIEEILAKSEAAFSQTVDPQEREYLFVLESVDDGKIIGTSMIHAQHGTRRAPHIFFRVNRDERYSYSLDRYFVHRTLRIGYNYDGPTEIGGLILLPEYRGHAASLGKLLSYTRFLFVAMHRAVFRDHVLSELLPPLEEDGTSILWEHLGKKFTGLTYQEADLLSKDNKEFIRALFPHGAIYTALLPDIVDSVIGEVAQETKGVEKMLRRIGFEYAEQIDPFDGGPHFLARTDDITVVKGAHERSVRALSTDEAKSAQWAIAAIEGTSRPCFRATSCRAMIDAQTGEAAVNSQAMDALGLGPGQRMWLVIP